MGAWPADAQVFKPADWEAVGMSDGTAYAERELKRALEGMAKHLFGERKGLAGWPMILRGGSSAQSSAARHSAAALAGKPGIRSRAPRHAQPSQ